MNMNDLAKEGIRVVKRKKSKFCTRTLGKIYFNWLENIEDWCVSRQIVWGHRIPAWYDTTEMYMLVKMRKMFVYDIAYQIQ